EGGWRLCGVDPGDGLQYPQASNALLKVLEEPPPRALFLLVAHAPGRLLPTIRSRCRRLTLRALEEADVARAAATALGRAADDPEVGQAAGAADGSVERAITLLGGPALALRERVNALLAGLPALDRQGLHALADQLARADAETFETVVDAIRDWLTRQLA